MSYVLNEESFLKDVADHQMVVIKNDGVNRHIRFKRPDTLCMHFDLVTWPGVLCYTGDMGTFVFSRLEDMFQFFRRSDDSYRIDKRYWAEKLLAADRDGFEKYSPDLFRARINDWLQDCDIDDETRDRIEDEVLSEADDNDYVAYRAAMEFNAGTDDEPRYIFQDFFEVSTKEYTHRFTWCCYALAWGIQQYDMHMAEQAVSA